MRGRLFLRLGHLRIIRTSVSLWKHQYVQIIARDALRSMNTKDDKFFRNAFDLINPEIYASQFHLQFNDTLIVMFIEHIYKFQEI